MKKILKSAISSLVVMLPLRARRAILNALAEDIGPLRAIQELAQSARISKLESIGNYGPIVSSPLDRVVFGTYATTGWWARNSNELIAAEFVGRSGTYLDIGANIGLTLIPLLSRTDVRCIGVEPDPTNYTNLQINVGRNSDRKDVELHNVALFNKPATLDFELAENNLGDHRLRTMASSDGIFGEVDRRVISVPGLPLDELIPNTPAGHFVIKLDTQGAEPFVIEGGIRTFQAAHMLLLEFSPYHLKRLGGNPEVILDLIEASFQTGCIATGEGPFGDWMPARKLVEILRGQWQDFVADQKASRYFDVCVKRE